MTRGLRRRDRRRRLGASAGASRSCWPSRWASSASTSASASATPRTSPGSRSRAACRRTRCKEAFASPEHRRAMLLALFIPLMNGSGYYVLFSYMPTFLKSQQIALQHGQALLVTAASLVAISIAIPYHGQAVRPGRPQARARGRRHRHGDRRDALLRSHRHRQRRRSPSSAPASWPSSSRATPASSTSCSSSCSPPGVRYSAYGLGYNISSALFGGTAPLLMTLLIAQIGNLHARLLRRPHRARHARRREHGQGPGAPPACATPSETEARTDVLQRLPDRPGDRRLHRHGRRGHRKAGQARPHGLRRGPRRRQARRGGEPHRHDAPARRPRRHRRARRRGRGPPDRRARQQRGRLGHRQHPRRDERPRSTPWSTSTCGRCCTCAAPAAGDGRTRPRPHRQHQLDRRAVQLLRQHRLPRDEGGRAHSSPGSCAST